MLSLGPDRREFAELARRGNLVPVHAERLADLITPVEAMLRLASGWRRPFLLDSAEGGENIGRYSFLGGDPFLEIIGDRTGVTLAHADGRTERLDGDPVREVASVLGRFHVAREPGLPPFVAGAVGYAAYDAVRWVEQIPESNRPEGEEPPWLYLAAYDTVVAFDHLRHRVLLVANGRVDDADDAAAVRTAYDDAVGRVEKLDERLRRPGALAAPLDDVALDTVASIRATSAFGEAEFCASVARAQDHIAAGDAFQVVLSRRLRCSVRADPLTVYRALRAINPSPYMFCLDTGSAHVVGSSPEMLVRVVDGVVETRPIAGTRKRGATPDEDLELECQLRADEKELAEHLMLVDLGRNDVGRVARYGTVEVPEYLAVERYSHVMHLVSSVRGVLRPGISPLDAMFASFPAGTVSGAPKIRAMEIIDDLEPEARGIYAGAVLYSDFAGNLDSCIAIRTIVLRDGEANVQAGAGIVADSVPERELEETREKATAALQALAWAEAALGGEVAP